MYVGSSDWNIDAYKVNFDGTLVTVGSSVSANARQRPRARGRLPREISCMRRTNFGASIVMFSINQTTGALTEIRVPRLTPSGAQPRGHGDRRAITCTSRSPGLNQVGQFSINPEPAALTRCAIAAGTSPRAPRRIEWRSPRTADFVYVSNYVRQLHLDVLDRRRRRVELARNDGHRRHTRPARTRRSQQRSAPWLLPSAPPRAVTNVHGLLDQRQRSPGTVASGATTGAAGANATGVTFDPSGQYIYVSNAGNGTITKFNIASNGALSGSLNFATGANPQFLLSRPAPSAPGGPVSSVPTLSTWSLVLLGMMLLGSSAFLYRRAYR